MEKSSVFCFHISYEKCVINNDPSYIYMKNVARIEKKRIELCFISNSNIEIELEI